MKKTKKITVIALLVCLVAACWAIEGVFQYDKSGTKVEPGQVHNLQDDWYTLGTFATATTTPGPTARTATAFTSDANNAAYTIPSKWNIVRIRCSSTTDGDTSVFDIFLMNGTSDHYTRVGTLTFTTGAQTATTSGHEYADTLVASNDTNTWHKDSTVMSPTGNYIAEWAEDVLGSEKIGISPTTITNTAVLEITGGP